MFQAINQSIAIIKVVPTVFYQTHRQSRFHIIQNEFLTQFSQEMLTNMSQQDCQPKTNWLYVRRFPLIFVLFCDGYADGHFSESSDLAQFNNFFVFMLRIGIQQKGSVCSTMWFENTHSSGQCNALENISDVLPYCFYLKFAVNRDDR